MVILAALTPRPETLPSLLAAIAIICGAVFA